VTRGRALALFSIVFVTAFFGLRSTSTFARVEARVDDVRAVAAESGLLEEEVMALLDLVDASATRADLSVLAARVARARVEHGELGLAVAVALGHRVLVRELEAEPSPSPPLARLRARPEGLQVTRFLTMVERYRAARVGR
jgi:hypothetical protein